ncbi:TPA: TraX family protein [Pseudomonas aeruginosa]|uniref:TraX family protein n=1 Tax=Pseudomonas aeruginosa TaxID=287 RepID=UPI0022CDD9C4|nr:TraX family protein [Pseudomonas aeruginosa]MBX6583439.1 hypothetical protein [Pseudomonas aeruginosa]MBX6631798.1 hypothetical protein [Pseudomonas aeruginosa]MCZ9831450.1 conjugal transfer protein TraX [Pseudomonas aeruginosa]HBO2152774.1 hypothetical protein [Pseudomonas aeruginosa]HCI2696233.1 hypothetical protein [Pseudomonas aeruginosa]
MGSQSTPDDTFDFSTSWAANETDIAPGRSAALDLVKWVALVAMTLDHLRFVWPVLEPLTLAGRFAFPAFAATMAMHAMRQGTPGRSTWRQLALLVGATVISQWPYHALTGHDQGNIMATLTCALVVLAGVRMPGWKGTALATAGVALPIWVPLEYGLLGVLLPSAFLFALTGTWRRWMLPVLIATIVNASTPARAAMGGAAAVACCIFLSAKLTLKAPPVHRWAYAYYPAHMAMLALLIP